MTEKELQKLTRQDLLELLLESERENESLRKTLDALKAEAEDRRLFMDKVGSIAEASLLLNGVFSAAQAAADQYVLNVKRVCEEKAERIRQADDIIQKAQGEARQIQEAAEALCRRMLRQAKEEADRYWDSINKSPTMEQITFEENAKGETPPAGE